MYDWQWNTKGKLVQFKITNQKNKLSWRNIRAESEQKLMPLPADSGKLKRKEDWKVCVPGTQVQKIKEVSPKHGPLGPDSLRPHSEGLVSEEGHLRGSCLCCASGWGGLEKVVLLSLPPPVSIRVIRLPLKCCQEEIIEVLTGRLCVSASWWGLTLPATQPVSVAAAIPLVLYLRWAPFPPLRTRAFHPLPAYVWVPLPAWPITALWGKYALFLYPIIHTILATKKGSGKRV